jgi:hypothetical protein
VKPKPRKIAHLEKRFAGLDVLAFEGLPHHDRAADRRQQVDRENVFTLFGQARHLFRAQPVLNQPLRRIPDDCGIPAPDGVLILADDVKQFRAIDRRERLAFLHILTDVFDIDFIDPSVIKRSDDAVDVVVIFEDPAEAQRLCQFETAHRHGRHSQDIDGQDSAK